jgi:hypothetical protein
MVPATSQHQIFIAQITMSILYSTYAYYAFMVYQMAGKLNKKTIVAFGLQIPSIISSVTCLINDIFIALPMALCIVNFSGQKITRGADWFIVASTFKLGAVFYLPAVVLIIWHTRGFCGLLKFSIALALTHILIALPFLSINHEAYLR